MNKDIENATVDAYFDKFIKDSKRTEVMLEELNLNKDVIINLFSIFIEISEILDGVKKAIFYNKDTKYTTELYDRIAKIQKHASAVSSPIFHDKNMRTRGDIINNVNPNLFHGVLGIMTESSELAEIINELFKNSDKVVDPINVHEEMHDISWYKAIIHHVLNLSWRQGMENNTNKLRIRYPEKFTDELAANRNLEEERKALEQ